MKKLYMSFALFLFALVSQAQTNRDMLWVHGLGSENGYFFNLYNRAFNSERWAGFGKEPQYNTQNGIISAANDLKSKIGNGGDSTTIAIAHSMGGLNCLQLKITSPNIFGGLITMGTPFSGAPVAVNITSPTTVQFFKDAMSRSTSGLLQDYVDDNLKMVGAFLNWTGLTSIIVNYVKELIERTIDLIHEDLEKLAFGHATASQNDLKPGSTAIGNLQNKTYGNMPRIAMWGNEDSPMVLRVGGSNYDMSFVHIGDISDNKLIDLVDKISNYFSTKAAAQRADAYNYTFWPMWWKVNECNETAAKLDIGYKFWHSELEPGLEHIIGSYKTETRTETYQDWVCDGSLPYLKSTNKIPQNCHWETKTRTVSVTVPTPNDGIVPDFSAKAMPGVQSQCIVRVDGVNHVQLLNSFEAKNKLDDIFDGNVQDTRKPDFFIIKRR